LKKHIPLLGVMATVAAGFFLVLKVGFLLHQDPQPGVIANDTLTAIAVLVLFAGIVVGMTRAIQAITGTASNARLRREANRSTEAYNEARRRRVAELAADPARSRYAALVEQGEDWSDENIAYYENRDRTVMCAHLQPIERAMRHAGIEVRRYRDSHIIASCRIDFAALQQTFAVGTPIRYAEFFQGERSEHERPTAFLICDAHQSIIHTVHPEAGSVRDAPWFPTSDNHRVV
jgi:hypothetical protein